MRSARGIESWCEAIAAALAIVVLLVAVQSHVLTDLCAISTEQADVRHENPHGASGHQDRSHEDCCRSACVFCVAQLEAIATMPRAFALTITPPWRSSRLTGQAPSPGWHPPRSAG